MGSRCHVRVGCGTASGVHLLGLSDDESRRLGYSRLANGDLSGMERGRVCDDDARWLSAVCIPRPQLFGSARPTLTLALFVHPSEFFSDSAEDDAEPDAWLCR